MLSNIFKPKSSYELIRLGKDNDGGYLVCPNSISKSTKLISFGLGTDWSFENDVLNFRNIPIDIYDHTIDNLFWKRYVWNAVGKFIFRKMSLYNFFLALTKKKSYNNFFSNPNVFHYQRAISAGNLNNAILLDEILMNKNYKNIFLKIDIEGTEYRVLDDLIKYQNIIDCLVIEFHSIDIHMEKIVEFIKKFSLSIIHIHANNADFVHNNIPAMIEMTFAKNPKITNENLFFPNPLDQACETSREDIKLIFN